MELLKNDENSRELNGLMYEKVKDFKYLSETLSTTNNRAKNIGIRLNKVKKTFFELTKYSRFILLLE